MMKIQMQPKKHEAAKHVFTTMLCMLAVLMVAFAPVTSALAIIQVETPEIVNTFVLGELGYKLVFDANKPATAPTDAQVDDMPVSADYEIEVAAASHTFTVDERPTLTGYQFMGWALTADATAANYPVIAAVEGTPAHCDVPVDFKEANQQYNTETATTTKTVYAVWKQMDFVLSFDTQTDGEVANPADQTITYQMPYGTHGELPKPERVGYNFIGWTLTPGDTAEDYISDQTIVENAGNHTVYAQWGAKSYVVRFNPNGGVGEVYTQTIEYDKPTELLKNTFTKNDYTFGGWALIAEAEEEDYIDGQIVTNLLEEGVLDLYALWIQDSHTVFFDYNGGEGSPDSKQVQDGKPYGTLPTYPTKYEHLFTGWYTKPTGGTRVYTDTIVNSTEDHTLYAQWIESPANDIIQGLVIKNNPDDDKDGIVDDIYLNFMCSSYFEKFNVPIERLVVGQRYKLTFKESNNATFGSNKEGYGGAIYGSIITTNGTLDKGSIREESIADGGLIAVYDDQFDPNKGNSWLNGPRDWEMTFVAEANTMYWTWDMGLIQDTAPNGPARDYNFTNIQLEPIPPTIKFGNKRLLKPSGYNAEIVSQTNSDYSTHFEFNGESGCETIYYPITGLASGSTYTITFDHKFTGNLLSGYDYGCGIMNAEPASNAMGSRMNQLGTWDSEKLFVHSTTTSGESVTLTFTANSDTAYWVWNMAGVSDAKNATIDVKVTEFSAKHKNGGTITYYTASSEVSSTALMFAAADLSTIGLTYALPGVTVTGADLLTANEPAVLTLTGNDIPDVLNVEVTGTQTTEPTVSTFALRSVEPVVEPVTDEAQTVITTLYMTGLNEALVNASAVAEGATAQAWITANADGSQTLILPAELMTEGATITITGASYNSYNLSEITYEHLN